MHEGRKRILTAAALFCRCLSCYPLWLLLSLRPDVKILPAMGCLLGITLPAACAVRAVRMHFRRGSKTAAVLSAILTLAAAAGCFAAVRLFGGGAVITALAVGLTLFFALFRIENEPDELYRLNGYAAFLSAAVIMSGLLVVAHMPVYINTTLAAVGGVSAVFFLLRNQFMLLRLVNRRSNTETDVPKDIRRGNLLLVLGVIAVLALIWVFRAPVLSFMTMMRNAANTIILTVLEFLVRVVNSLSGRAPDSEEVQEVVAEAERYRGSTSPLWMLFWLPVIAVGIYVWRVLLSDWAEDFRILFRRWLRRMRGTADDTEQPQPAPDAEYYDTETVIQPEDTPRKRRQQWRKALRQWQKQPDSREKFYQGYLLLLKAPCWAERELRESDTVREIREKWLQGHTPQAALDAVTDAFHADRYAETGLPADAVAELGRALQTIS